ncbi:MAG: MBL fold metallo-hydrolase [bacterium]|nr:MBL fold metallo-hydrolase [bacterium]
MQKIKKIIKALLISLLVLIILTAGLFLFKPHTLLVVFGHIIAEKPALLKKLELNKNAIWYDNYYAVTYIDKKTIAIGQPRYHHLNYSYLLLGEKKALLFDAGSGTRPLKPLIKKLTDLPVTVMVSHIHYDHSGNMGEFKKLALLDIKFFKKQLANGMFTPTKSQHLGFTEELPLPTVRISQWVKPGSTFDLGNRKIKIFHTPSHTPGSMMLFDKERNQIFIGDFLYNGKLFTFLPGVSLASYYKTTGKLLSRLNNKTKLYLGHSSKRSINGDAPALSYSDLEDLYKLLVGIKEDTVEGSGFYPQEYKINETLSLLTDISWNMDL